MPNEQPKKLRSLICPRCCCIGDPSKHHIIPTSYISKSLILRELVDLARSQGHVVVQHICKKCHDRYEIFASKFRSDLITMFQGKGKTRANVSDAMQVQFLVQKFGAQFVYNLWVTHYNYMDCSFEKVIAIAQTRNPIVVKPIMRSSFETCKIKMSGKRINISLPEPQRPVFDVHYQHGHLSEDLKQLAA